ncbi:hypothetical protein ACE6H2_016595 [Prunus campanulata]
MRLGQRVEDDWGSWLIDITLKIIESIFDHCALLETLDMGRCHGFRYLRIHAQKQNRFRALKVGNCDAEVHGIKIDAPSLRSLLGKAISLESMVLVLPKSFPHYYSSNWRMRVDGGNYHLHYSSPSPDDLHLLQKVYKFMVVYKIMRYILIENDKE